MVMLLVFTLLGTVAEAQNSKPRSKSPPQKSAPRGSSKPKVPDTESLPKTTDQGGSVELDLDADPDELERPLLKQARAARPRIDKLRKATLATASAGSLILPADETVDLVQKSEDRYLDYRLLELAAYRKSTKDRGEARIAAERFLDRYLRGGATPAESNPTDSPASLGELGQAALKAGSRDPLFAILQAYSQYSSDGDSKSAEPIWNECLRQLPKSDYSPAVELFARTFLMESGLASDRNAAQQRWAPLVLAAVRWLEHEGVNPSRRDSIFRRLQRVWYLYPAGQKQLVAACLQSSQIDPYYAHMLAGHHHNDRGWRARGTQFAHKVKPEDMEQFHKHLALAAEHFQHAWALAPELPYPQAAMISISSALPPGTYKLDQPLDWFRRTVSARLDMYSAYVSINNALLTRWGGSTEQLLDLGRACMATDRFDTMVPCHIIDVLLAIEQWELEDTKRLPEVVDLELLLREYLKRRSDYREQHPDEWLQANQTYYRTRLFRLLMMAGLHEEAAAELDEADGQLDFAYLRRDQRLAAYGTLLVQTGADDPMGRILKFDQQLRRPWTSDTPAAEADAIEGSMRELQVDFADRKGSAKYFRHAARIIEQLRAFSRGDWAELTFDAEGLGWEVHADDWRFLPDANEVRLFKQGRIAEQLWVQPLAQFQPPLEMEFDLEDVGPLAFSYTSGVQWHAPHLTETAGEQADARVLMNLSPVGAFNAQAPRRDAVSFPTDGPSARNGSRTGSRARHHVRIRLWERSCEGTVDSGWGVSSFSNPLTPNGTLVFGDSDQSASSRYELRIANVRVRKLDQPAPPQPDASPETQKEYWETRLARAPNDHLAAFQLCELLLAERQSDRAQQLADQISAENPEFAGIAGLRGRILFQRGRYSEALDVIGKYADNERDFRAWAAIVEIQSAGSTELRKPAKLLQITVNAMTSRKQPIAETLAARAVFEAAFGNFEQARSSNREAIDLAREPYKSELAQRQKLYDANQPFVLPPEVKAE